MWDLAAAKRQARLTGHSRAVWSLAYSQGDGSILASGGADCTVRLWDAKAAEAAAGSGGGPGQQQQQRGGAAAAAQGGGGKGGSGPLLLETFRTKATPVFGLRFSTRNLLLCGGALTLYRPSRLYS